MDPYKARTTIAGIRAAIGLGALLAPRLTGRTTLDFCIEHFARHNVLVDPPFSRVDLVSCRNPLTYLEPPIQQRVVTILHYALKPRGVLWLVGSETIGPYRDLFEVQDTAH